MLKDDQFPNFGGRVDIKGLDFSIWDAPAPFKVYKAVFHVLSCS